MVLLVLEDQVFLIDQVALVDRWFPVSLIALVDRLALGILGYLGCLQDLRVPADPEDPEPLADRVCPADRWLQTLLGLPRHRYFPGHRWVLQDQLDQVLQQVPGHREDPGYLGGPPLQSALAYQARQWDPWPLRFLGHQSHQQALEYLPLQGHLLLLGLP